MYLSAFRCSSHYLCRGPLIFPTHPPARCHSCEAPRSSGKQWELRIRTRRNPSTFGTEEAGVLIVGVYKGFMPNLYDDDGSRKCPREPRSVSFVNLPQKPKKPPQPPKESSESEPKSRVRRCLGPSKRRSMHLRIRCFTVQGQKYPIATCDVRSATRSH